MRLLTLAIFLVASLLAALPAAAEPAYVRLAMESGGEHVETSGPAISADTPFAIASVGKLFTAVAVLRLVDRGEIGLDAAVEGLLPPETLAAFDDLSQLQLVHLLTMSSGLPDYYTDDWFDAAMDDPDAFQTAASALQEAGQEALLFAPGDAFNYSNTDYLMLGLILEAVTGNSYADAMRAEVFAPAGLQDSFVFGSRPLPESFAHGHTDRAAVRQFYSGAGFGDGGIIASARDVARFYRALFVDKVLLSDAALGIMLLDLFGEAYGMGVEIDGDTVGHSGGDIGYSSDVRLDLQSGDVAVVLIASEDADTDWAWERLDKR